MKGNRPRIKLFTNTRMDGGAFVHSWLIRGWFVGAKVNAFPLAALRGLPLLCAAFAIGVDGEYFG